MQKRKKNAKKLISEDIKIMTTSETENRKNKHLKRRIINDSQVSYTTPCEPGL